VNLNRRAFLAATGGLALSRTLGSMATLPALGPPTSFSLQIHDGYAYIFTNNRKNLVIGGIDMPATPLMPKTPTRPAMPAMPAVVHPMILRVEQGTIQGQMPMPPEPGTSDRWDLTHWHASLDLGRRTKSLSVPRDTWPNSVSPPKTLQEWNNLGYLAPMSQIYPGARMSPDWRTALSSLFVVNQGLLTVLESDAMGFWRFKNDSGDVVAETLMSDSTLLSETIEPTDDVELKLSPWNPSLGVVSATSTVVIKPSTTYSQIKLHIENGLPPGQPYQIGVPVRHFSRYQQLLKHGTFKETLPYFCGYQGGEGACPGDFCPYMRCDV
jgi:hypothetical protein